MSRHGAKLGNGSTCVAIERPETRTSVFRTNHSTYPMAVPGRSWEFSPQSCNTEEHVVHLRTQGKVVAELREPRLMARSNRHYGHFVPALT